MIKLKPLWNKSQDNKENIHIRKKTYDFKNSNNLDNENSKLDINIKKSSISKRDLFNKNPVAINATNFPIILRNKNCFDISSINHCNTITTNYSYREKPLKKVTFTNVEIIRVENYKKYNLACNYSKNQIKKNMDELKNNEYQSVICFIF